jgi:nucleotidyltransferase substrate binding protein (TIGR01987 family)
MKLDLTAYEKAVSRLEESLKYFNSELSKNDEGLKAQFRGASIQAFEYTYGLCVKMIKRQLEQITAEPSELDEMAFMDMMRSAAEAGLIRDPIKFKNYRDKRNLTSHTYDEEKAKEIMDVLDGFLQDVRFTLDELKRRNA